MEIREQYQGKVLVLEPVGRLDLPAFRELEIRLLVRFAQPVPP